MKEQTTVPSISHKVNNFCEMNRGHLTVYIRPSGVLLFFKNFSYFKVKNSGEIKEEKKERKKENEIFKSNGKGFLFYVFII